ncbi:MAG: hypothetical protein Q9222_007579 [Ikaeria aurantiellina]
MATVIEPSTSLAIRTRSKKIGETARTPQSQKWESLDEHLSALASRCSSSPTKKSKKRKRDTESSSAGKSQEGSTKKHSSSKKSKTASPKKKEEEKRLRVFRKQPPHTYLQKLNRAISQRMFVLSRTRTTKITDNHPSETITMAGTTGNIYKVTINLIPSCTCPDYLKGHQCKHIIYVLHNVLKAPAELEYQLAFLSSELKRIFDAAPLPAATDDAAAAAYADHQDRAQPTNRKAIAGDCPICFMEFEPEKGEEIVWCKAACGNNIHKHCFERWVKSSGGKHVKCVYCRTRWQGDTPSISKIMKEGRKVNEEGYVNIAEQLGLSGPRDTSTYHPYWVRRQQSMGGWGYIHEDEDEEWSGED